MFSWIRVRSCLPPLCKNMVLVITVELKHIGRWFWCPGLCFEGQGIRWHYLFCLYVPMSLWLSVHMSICLSVRLSAGLSVCLCQSVSVCQVFHPGLFLTARHGFTRGLVSYWCFATIGKSVVFMTPNISYWDQVLLKNFNWIKPVFPLPCPCPDIIFLPWITTWANTGTFKVPAYLTWLKICHFRLDPHHCNFIIRFPKLTWFTIKFIIVLSGANTK